MPERQRILVTGGAGFIGSHTVLALLDAGYDVLVGDNFCNSSPVVLERISELAGRPADLVKLDFRNRDDVMALFQRERIDAVIHFAGFKAVGESWKKPLAYYQNNLISTVNVLDAMRANDVECLVFSSSATVYGDPDTNPVTEDFPVRPESPYGRTKLFVEEMLRDAGHSDAGLSIGILRYFNPVGAHESGKIGEDPHGIPNNLMPFVSQVAVGQRDELPVFGDDYATTDGTGVRDYIHVMDLAEGHVAALAQLFQGKGVHTWNLGTGRPYSVREVVAAFERASDRKIPTRVVGRRDGDVAIYYADPAKANRELGWSADRDIDAMARDAWNWQNGNPHGFRNN